MHVGKYDFNVDAGDQGIMFGYASDETDDVMLLTHSMAIRLGKKLNDVRKNGALWWLRPEQSLVIAGGVHVGKDGFDVGAGDQGIIFRDETEDATPLTHSMASRLRK